MPRLTYNKPPSYIRKYDAVIYFHNFDLENDGPKN